MSNEKKITIHERIERINKLRKEKMRIKDARVHRLQSIKDDGTITLDIRKTRGSYKPRNNKNPHYGDGNEEQLDLFNVDINKDIKSKKEYLHEINTEAKRHIEETKIEEKEERIKQKTNKINKKVSLFNKRS